jgi:hypothetical protein
VMFGKMSVYVRRWIQDGGLMSYCLVLHLGYLESEFKRQLVQYGVNSK